MTINKKKKELLCPHCFENLFEVGIIEVIVNRNTEINIIFTKYAETGKVLSENEERIYTKCLSCGGKIFIDPYYIKQFYDSEGINPLNLNNYIKINKKC